MKDSIATNAISITLMLATSEIDILAPAEKASITVPSLLREKKQTIIFIGYLITLVSFHFHLLVKTFPEHKNDNHMTGFQTNLLTNTFEFMDKK